MGTLLIVGAGTAGLALAIALRQRGFLPEIIERSPSLGSAGAGLYLVGIGVRALQALGVADALRQRSCVIRSQALYDHRGKRLAEVDAGAFWASCGPCLGVRRTELQAVLAAAAPDVRFGVTVHDLRQADQAVEVRFSDGGTRRFDLVIGADGIRSSVRELGFGGSSPVFRGQVGWRFIARRPRGVDGWTAYLGARSAFLLVPIDREHVYCYADIACGQPFEDAIDGRADRLRELFKAFAHPVQEALAKVADEQIHFAAIEEVIGEHLVRKRVVLVGDAAHAMSPNMACGAAMALEDALVLAELVSRHGASLAAASAFSARRAGRLKWVRSQTNRRDRMRNLIPALRDPLLRLLWRRLYRDNYAPLLSEP